MSSLDLAVKLFIESGRRIQSWTTRFIAANGALFAALGAFIAWGDPAEDDLHLFNYVLMAICLLGALCSVMFGGAILRQQRWSNHFFDRIRALQDQQNPLLPRENELLGRTFVASLTVTTTVLISIAWLALLVLILHFGTIVETSVKA